MRKNILSYPVETDNKATTFRALIGADVRRVLQNCELLNEKIDFSCAENAFDRPNLF